jgi:hypothetical protein
VWDLSVKEYSWATGGYMGAILSGQTVCGLLIGSSIAIGLRYGQGKEGVPEEHEGDRNKAIQAVGELYRNFLQEFGSTECKTLSKCDWSNSEDVTRWIQEKGWKSTCDVYLKFAMNKCVEMAEAGKV